VKQNKKTLLAVIIGLVVIIIVVAAVMVFGKGTAKQAQTPQEQAIQVVPTISEEEIGFSFTAGPANHTVILELAKPEGIKSVEYTFTYTDKNDIERGAQGELDLKKTPAAKELTLGTCSDVCHYDEGVSSVKIILKVTKDDGKIYQLQKTLDLK
jgi:hypothetical protein